MVINATQSPFIQWELNEDGTRKTTEQLNEEIKIINNQAVLNFKPSRYHRVNIASQLIGVENVVFTEIDANEKINLINQFKVNYENGIVYFYPDLEGYTLTVSKYYSEGLILYHASRIYDYDSEGAIITFDNFDGELSTANQNITELQNMIKITVGSVQPSYGIWLEETLI